MHGLTTYYEWEELNLNVVHVADGEGGLKLTYLFSINLHPQVMLNPISWKKWTFPKKFRIWNNLHHLFAMEIHY